MKCQFGTLKSQTYIVKGFPSNHVIQRSQQHCQYPIVGYVAWHNSRINLGNIQPWYIYDVVQCGNFHGQLLFFKENKIHYSQYSILSCVPVIQSFLCFTLKKRMPGNIRCFSRIYIQGLSGQNIFLNNFKIVFPVY